MSGRPVVPCCCGSSGHRPHPWWCQLGTGDDAVVFAVVVVVVEAEVLLQCEWREILVLCPRVIVCWTCLLVVDVVVVVVAAVVVVVVVDVVRVGWRRLV